jgi:glycosyltransferase involved in cell wall biosynthesis
MASPTVSVIVPTRNRPHLLPRALESLEAQSFKDFEIVIIDDNDPEKRIAKDPKLANWLNRPRVRVIEHLNPKNAAAARNCGLEAAWGDWITYLDDDDAYCPTKIERQWRGVTEKKFVLATCGAVYHLAKGRRRERFDRREVLPRNELLLAHTPLPTLFHCRTAARFDESLNAGEDSHFFYRLVDVLKADTMFNVPDALTQIYPQPGPRVNTNGEGLWQAHLAIHREFGASYGERTAEVYLARALLQRCKFDEGKWLETFRRAVRLVKLHGVGEWRLILNAVLFKLPIARRFLVS